MRIIGEAAPHELYLRSTPLNKPNAPLKLYANITGKITVERELDQKIEDKVSQSTADAAKAKNSRRIVVIDEPPPKKPAAASAATTKKKKAGTSVSVTRRAPQIIQAKNEGSSRLASPAPNHGKALSPLRPPAATTNINLRQRVIRCVAASPRTQDEVVNLVGGPSCADSTRRDVLAQLEDVRAPSCPL